MSEFALPKVSYKTGAYGLYTCSAVSTAAEPDLWGTVCGSQRCRYKQRDDLWSLIVHYLSQVQVQHGKACGVPVRALAPQYGHPMDEAVL